MKQISTSLTSKLRTDSIIERDYIIFSGETTKHYIWFNLYDDCYKDGNFIGTFIMKRIEISYNDSNLEFKNKEFNAYKEYKLDDGSWESIDYGTFIVTDVKPSDTKEEIKVTAYDYALKFANPYVTELNYESGSVSLFQVLQEVCLKVGVELENTNIDNGDFIVDSNQFNEDSMYGNVITAIAQISCNFAKIMSNNKLKFQLMNETSITIQLNDYENLENKRDTHPYNAVSLGLTNIDGENVTMVDPSVQPGQENYLIINDNPFAYTEEKRGQLIQAIFNKINGFGYSSFVLENCLYPQLECGDLIKIKNKDGQLTNSIILRPTFEETILNFEAPSVISSTVTYQNPVSAYDVAKRTEYIVNKQESIITQLVSETNNNTTQINNNYQEIINKFQEYAPQSSIDSIQQSVTQLQTSSYTKTEIQKIINGTYTDENNQNISVSKVFTTSGTFDENGMHYEKTGSKTNSTINEIGVTVNSTQNNEEVLFAGFDEEINESIVRTENLTVRKYLVIGYNSRLENYEDGTGVFIL